MTTTPGQEQKQVSILFADVSGFTKLRGAEVRAFTEEAMTRVAKHLDEFRPIVTNTWGDAIFAVFELADAAADCALDIRDVFVNTYWPDKGIYGPLRLRIALHNAPAIMFDDPITKRPNAVGQHINQAARLEPVTLPNEIFATQAFRNALDQFGKEVYQWDEVGKISLAKGWGENEVYRLRRPKEAELGKQEIREIKEGSRKKRSWMPRAEKLLQEASISTGEVQRVLEHVDEFFFEPPVIRYNWTIQLKYDLSRFYEDAVIGEVVTWNYDLVNIGNEIVDYPQKLIGSQDLESKAEKFSWHRVNPDGTEEQILEEGFNAKNAGGERSLQTRERVLKLEPGVRYKNELRHYRHEWPVHSATPVIHNSFAPRQVSFVNRLELQGPFKRVPGLLVGDADLEPVSVRGNEYIYNVPSPIFRDQALELLLFFKV